MEAVLNGADPGTLFRNAHGQWFLQLFQPFAAAGLYDRSALAGYRNRPVFIRGSRHVPPRAELLPDCMEALFELLEHEPEPAVRAVVGHWMLGYAHPFPDGNGRMARFLMNAMLASGGYPWTTIRVELRRPYMAALEEASVGQNISAFAEFVAGQLALPLGADRRQAPDSDADAPAPARERSQSSLPRP